MNAEREFRILEWAAPHRPEIQAYIKALAGREVDRGEFIAAIKAMNLPRTSPAKCKSIYRYLLMVGFINQPTNV